MNNKINGGATIWARKTIESDIFYWKPDIWFKIWFYIVNKVNHKDTKLFKRGSNFFNYNRERAYIKGSTVDQWKKCVGWLKGCDMVSTKKSTRGVIIEVLNYAFYQDLSNYKAPQQAPVEAPEKHYESTTINKNDNNDKYFPAIAEKKKVSSLTASSGRGFRKYDENASFDEPSIDADTREMTEVSSRKIDNYTKVYNELIAWAEERRGFKFLTLPKQRAALKKLREAKISVGDIKARWRDIEENPPAQGFDFGYLVYSFNQKRK